MDQTLEELRAENAAANANVAETPQVESAEVNNAAAEVDTDTDDHAGDQGDEADVKAEPESWMKVDDQESSGAAPKFTDSDIGAAKAKLRAKLEAKHRTELETLQAQLEEARRTAASPQQLAKPTRDQFWEAEDPEDAYVEALADWKLKTYHAQQQAQSHQFEQQRRHLEQQQQISTDVDQHYERAAALAAASGISPELYQSADFRVRSAIDGVFPGMGERVTDDLIANLGEGSEKVFYNLGVNPKRLSELTSLLKQDPKGIKASIYLGKLSAELTAPLRKKSATPPPATSVQGDMQTTEAGKGLHRKYLEARKSGDAQKAFSIRQEARASKINVDTW